MSIQNLWGLSVSHYQARRRQLMERMGSDSIAILPAAPVAVRNRDVEYKYRQCSDFLYLTGFVESQSIAVFIPERPEGEFILFCRSKDAEKEKWDGFLYGQAGAVEVFGADQAYPVEVFEKSLSGLMQGKEKVYYDLGAVPAYDQTIIGVLNQLRAKVRSGVVGPQAVYSLACLIHEMRLIKSSQELDLMARAAEISAVAHIKAMQACRQFSYEYQLEALLQYEFAFQGASSVAYPSIVGGGANACVLHYIDNRARLQPGELVLIDAGAEYQHYAADITRTFPVSGTFSAEQKALYELVLQAQSAAIEQVRPGRTWDQPDVIAVRVLTEGLVDLNLLQGSVETLIEEKAYKSFYMHRTGHWLGLDVHDVGTYKVKGQWRTLEPGMVLTVEPGLYIAPDCETVDPCWRGIGIRIEDDVVVTEGAPRVLTEKVPKTVETIETLMR